MECLLLLLEPGSTSSQIQRLCLKTVMPIIVLLKKEKKKKKASSEEHRGRFEKKDRITMSLNGITPHCRDINSFQINL